MGGSNKKNKRKKSVNSPELNSEGTKQRTKQKKMADTPQPVKPVQQVQQPVQQQQQQQYAQASNLSYLQMLQSGLNPNTPSSPYVMNNGMQNVTGCFSPPPMQSVQSPTLMNTDVLNKILSRLDTIDNKLQRLDSIEKSVSEISLKVEDTDKKVAALESKMATIEHGLQFESDTLSEIEKKQSVLQKDIQTLKASQQLLTENENKVKEQMLDLQCREMRDNLLFFNVPEARGETDSDCEDKILDIMQDHMQIENAKTDIKLHRTHRIGRYYNGKTRPIVTKFAYYPDRERVRKAGAMLKENRSPYSVGQQYPREVQERRKALVPIMKQARENGRDAYIVVDRLYIDKNLYRGPVASNFNTNSASLFTAGSSNTADGSGMEHTMSSPRDK